MKNYPVTRKNIRSAGTRLWLVDGKVVYLSPPSRRRKAEPSWSWCMTAPETGARNTGGTEGRYKLEGMVIHAAADRAAEPDAATVREFLKQIHYYAGRATDGLERPGFLQMCRLHPSNDKLLPCRFRIGDLDRTVEAALADAAHSNVYVEGRTVRELNGNERGKLNDTRWVFAIVVDSDTDKGKAGTVPDGATMVVETSADTGNRHHWFVLSKAIPAGEAKEIGDAMRAATGSDSDTGNVTQPYRVAGTPNFPSASKRARGRTAITATRIVEHSGLTWTADELRAAFPAKPRAATGETNSSGQGGDEASLPADLLDLIKNGVAEGERSQQFQSAVWKLKHKRWSDDAIVALFEKYPGGIAAKYAEGNRLRDHVKISCDKFRAEHPALPTIGINKGEIPRIVAQTADALKRKGVPLYSRGGSVVMPIVEEMPTAKGGTTLVTHFSRVAPEAMQMEMAHAADFVTWKIDSETKKPVAVPADPPHHIAKMMLADGRHYKVPPVTGIITTPLMRPDGSLLDKGGYDPQSRLYYVADPSVRLPAIPERPTEDDAMVAHQLLTDLLSEFRFEGELDRAVALSGLLTALVRPSMSVAPMHLMRAHVAGTGKSYLVDTCSVTATGQRCPVIVAPKSEEELEKRLGAMVMSGVPIISLDNVEYDLGGPTLCQLTERPRVRLRILGRSEAPEFDCKAAVFATGNNVAVRGDMTRRALICTMDAMEERPELRAFKHRPVEIVLADRGKYIAAALTMIRAYVRRGVQVKCDPIGSYDEYHEHEQGSRPRKSATGGARVRVAAD